MKHVVKSVLPIQVINFLRYTRDMNFLNATKEKNFVDQNLITQDKISLDEVFSNNSIYTLWNKDHLEIKTLFENKDKLEGVNPGDRRALYYLISYFKPQSVLEVGTHIGASTLYIAKAMSNYSKSGSVTTVDILDVNDCDAGPWKRLNLNAPPIEMLERLGLSGLVNFKARPVLEYLKDTDKKFDFIFLDGDHSSSSVYQEVSMALQRLNSGGLILLHDYYPNKKALFEDKSVIYGPFLALERVIKEKPNINALPLGHLPWKTKQNSSSTSLCLVVKKS